MKGIFTFFAAVRFFRGCSKRYAIVGETASLSNPIGNWADDSKQQSCNPSDSYVSDNIDED